MDLPLTAKMKRVSATTQVIETIRSLIDSGELHVGDKLPNEMELAKSLGVGRSSLREGVRMLSSFGLLDIKHGEGTFVANQYAQRIFGFLGYEANPENIAYMLQLREVVEIGNIRIAAEKVTDEQLDELQVLVNELNPAVNPLEKAEKADFLFHRKIVQFAGNPLILETYKMMSSMLSLIFKNLMYREDVVLDAYKAHIEVLDALRERDVPKSVQAMEAHLAKVNYYARKYALTE